MSHRTISTVATFGVLVIIATSAILAVKISSLSGTSTSANPISLNSTVSSTNSSSFYISLNETAQGSSETNVTSSSSNSTSSYANITTDNSSSHLTSYNTTLPIPPNFGDVYGPVPLIGQQGPFVGSAEYGFQEIETDRLITNQSAADLDCSTAGSGGGNSSFTLESEYTTCYEVNSTGYQKFTLDTVTLNLTMFNPSSYKFELNSSGAAMSAQDYNWTFGDGTFGISNSSNWIEHNYLSGGKFNVTVEVAVSATFPSGQKWTLVDDFVIMITVPETVTTSSSTITNITSTTDSINSLWGIIRSFGSYLRPNTIRILLSPSQ